MKTAATNARQSPARQRRRRMAVALAASTLFIMTALSLLPGFPTGRIPGAAYSLVVTLAGQRATDSAGATMPDVPGAPPDEARQQAVPKVTPGPATDAAETTSPSPGGRKPDWYASLARVAGRSDELLPGAASLSPAFDEARRLAAARFAPAGAAVERPVWENVEPDQLGRKLLWSGNCYRVIEDNAVTRQWVHDNFTQYLVFCNHENTTAPIQVAFTRESLADFRLGLGMARNER